MALLLHENTDIADDVVDFVKELTGLLLLLSSLYIYRYLDIRIIIIDIIA